MGFPRQEYWSGLPCSPPGDLPDPGAESRPLTFPVLAGGFFTSSTTWEALQICYYIIIHWNGVSIPFFRRSSQFRDQAQVSCISGRFFIVWVTREALPENDNLTQSSQHQVDNECQSACYWAIQCLCNGAMKLMRQEWKLSIGQKYMGSLSRRLSPASAATEFPTCQDQKLTLIPWYGFNLGNTC